MQLTGAEIVVRCLQEEKVEYVFGYPGGSVLFIYDELFKQDKFKHVLVRHEQAAVHAADAYSRSSNKIGVCMVTSGPGVTNAVTGIATAYMDSVPMVIISGQVPTPTSDRMHSRSATRSASPAPVSSTISSSRMFATWR
jgi:acetolactate synthase-1/2/3 large subunit